MEIAERFDTGEDMIRQGWLVTCSMIALGTGAGAALHEAMTPGIADAGVDKVYPGPWCKPVEAGVLSTGAAYSFMQVINISLEAFACPFVRDSLDGNLDDVWVRLVNEQDGGEDIWCCVHSVSLGGTFTDIECLTAPENDRSPVLHFTLDEFTEFDSGHQMLLCRIGDFDGIRSIRTHEN